MTWKETIPACRTFPARLADAMDGALGAAAYAELQSHARACAGCGRLWRQARSGKQWLDVVEDVALPPQLISGILAATTGASRPPVPVAWRPPAAAWSWLALLRQPRFAMTAAMAFFSVSMLASVTGATLDDAVRLNPARIVTRASLRYHEATAGVVRYYENHRLRQELQNRLRDLRDVILSPSPKAAEQETPSHG